MIETRCFGRTAWVGPLEEREIKDSQGVVVRTIKTIAFTIACQREYPITKADGTKEYISDFVSCRAYDRTAEAIANHASDTRLVNGKEKLVSRRVLVSGHMETYEKTEKVTIAYPSKVKVTVNGVKYDVTVPDFEREQKVKHYTLVVNKINFIDPKETTTVEATLSASVEDGDEVEATISLSAEVETSPSDASTTSSPTLSSNLELTSKPKSNSNKNKNKEESTQVKFKELAEEEDPFN